MSFSSIADMLSAAQERTQPLYAVIRDADCLENGYDAAASHRQIAALWAAMQASTGSIVRMTAPTAGSSAATRKSSARRRKRACCSAGRIFSA